MTLSKYISLIDQKIIDYKQKPFEMYIFFYNLNFNNNIRDLREHIKDFLDLVYIEQLNGEIYLFVWEKENAEII